MKHMLFRFLLLSILILIFRVPLYAQNEPPSPDIRLYWSPDSTQATVVLQNDIRLYDALLTEFTSLPLGFPEDSFDILAVSWSPIGSRLSVEVKTTFDRYIQIWDTQPIQLVSQLHENAITRSTRWSPEGQQYAVVVNSNSIRIYNANTASLVSEFVPLSLATIQNFAWNPVRNEIVVGIGTSLYFWNIITNTQRGELNNAFNSSSIAFSPDGNTLATVAVTGGNPYTNLAIWDVDTLQLDQTLIGHTDSIYRLAWANNERIATVSFDRTIRVWDVPTGQTIRVIPVDLVHQIEWYPDDENLYVIDHKIVVNVLTGDAVEFEFPSSLPMPTNTPPPTATFTPTSTPTNTATSTYTPTNTFTPTATPYYTPTKTN
jgi:WD40 repeat protein